MRHLFNTVSRPLYRDVVAGVQLTKGPQLCYAHRHVSSPFIQDEDFGGCTGSPSFSPFRRGIGGQTITALSGHMFAKRTLASGTIDVTLRIGGGQQGVVSMSTDRGGVNWITSVVPKGNYKVVTLLWYNVRHPQGFPQSRDRFRDLFCVHNSIRERVSQATVANILFASSMTFAPSTVSWGRTSKGANPSTLRPIISS